MPRFIMTGAAQLHDNGINCTGVRAAAYFIPFLVMRNSCYTISCPRLKLIMSAQR